MAAASPIPALADLPLNIRSSIEAWRFPGVSVGSADTLMALEEWLCRHQPDPPCRLVGDKLIVPTARGVEGARKGDWIYRCQDGRLIVVRQIEHALPWPLREANERSAAGSYLLSLGVDPGPDPVGLLIAMYVATCRQLAERSSAEPSTPPLNTELAAPNEPLVPRRALPDSLRDPRVHRGYHP